jgi:hypothetical protein
MHADRRIHPRRDANFLVQHTAAAGAVDYARDISESGIFVASAHRPGVGDTVQVQFSPDRGQRFVVAFCRVARVTPDGFGAELVWSA